MVVGMLPKRCMTPLGVICCHPWCQGNLQKQETKKLAGPEHLFGYPLINIQQTMENHLFSWENSL
jgi:hypothetical protein